MSDRLKDSDLELELRDVIVALKDVAGTQWYDLGLQLKLPPSILDTIASDHQTADDCKRMMLRRWLQSDPEASWEKLSVALTLTGHEATAAVIRRQFSLISTSKDEDSTTEEDKIRLMLTRKNLNKIKGQFSSLLLKVQAALKSHQVSVNSLRNFLVHYFSRGDWIHDPSDLDELFTALSIAKLWNYDHYDPLEEITKQFLPDDADVKKFVSDYKNQLTGFYTITKITDFIKLSDFEDSEQDPQQPLPVYTFTLKDYRKLKLKLKLDRKVSAITLSYVDELWRSLAEEFDLPCLTAVIHSIIEGSLVVTWLVLPHIAKKIIANCSKATKFFRCHGIVMLEIDDVVVYDEEMMVTFEKELFTICEGFPHVDSNTTSRISHLLNYGVDPNISDKDGYTPLFWASMTGLIDIMKIFLCYGANVNQHCDVGMFPLYVAVGNKQTAAVKLLLEHGADVDLPTKDAGGNTALFCACWYGHVDVARLLLDHGAAIDYQNLEGVSPLYLASQEGHFQLVQVLLEYGASVSLVNENGQGDTPLIAACYNGHPDIARILLEHGAVINYQNREGRSALLYACRNNQAESVKLLLVYGAEKDASSLYIASVFGCLEIVRLLLKYGIQVTFSTGKSALHATCMSGHSQVAKVLIENGAVVNAQTEEGYTPLLLACSGRYSETIAVLLRAGAMPDIAETDGVTSLMLAAGQEDTADIVAALVKAKADPNIRDNKSGRTALWYAAAVGNAPAIEILLENGATMDIRDKTGLTAYDVASINSNPAVCSLLEQYGYQPQHRSIQSLQLSLGHQHDEITSLDTVRAILEQGSVQSQDDASLKHQTSHMSQEESEEADL